MEEAVPRPTLEQTVREELREHGRRSRYYTDLVGDHLEPRSWAVGTAAEITGADNGSAVHTAVWTVLVASGAPNGPVLGWPGSKVSLVETVVSAVGGNPARSSHIVAARFKRVCEQILSQSAAAKAPGSVVRLCRSAATGLDQHHLPDPLELAADLTTAFVPCSQARRDLIGRWQSRAARTR